MESNDISEWWNNWLKRFLGNRKKNKPTALKVEENQEIVELIPVLISVFDEAVEIICKGPLPSRLNSSFWYSLNEAHVASKHSKSMARLLVSILNATSDVAAFETDWIKSICLEIDGLTTKEQRSLQEALLKKNIEI